MGIRPYCTGNGAMRLAIAAYGVRLSHGRVPAGGSVVVEGW
jgi:hypothetical protein